MRRRVLTIKAVNTVGTKDLGLGYCFMNKVVWWSCLWAGIWTWRPRTSLSYYNPIYNERREKGQEIYTPTIQFYVLVHPQKLSACSGLGAHQHWKTKHFSNEVHKVNEVRFGYSVIKETRGIASCCRNWKQSRQQPSAESMLKQFHTDRNMAVAGVSIFLG